MAIMYNLLETVWLSGFNNNCALLFETSTKDTPKNVEISSYHNKLIFSQLETVPNHVIVNIISRIIH